MKAYIDEIFLLNWLAFCSAGIFVSLTVLKIEPLFTVIAYICAGTLAVINYILKRTLDLQVKTLNEAMEILEENNKVRDQILHSEVYQMGAEIVNHPDIFFQLKEAMERRAPKHLN